MKIFNGYGSYYDLFYKEKDYPGECDFLESLLRDHRGDRVSKILDLGCGTGEHGLILAKRGYKVTGIDQSGVMLDQARNKANKHEVDIRYEKMDIRNFDLLEKFDAIISMFDVMGYINSNKDLSDTFGHVANHLEPNGVFIFDVWFGPGVITDLPTYREKVIQQGEVTVKRIADPEFDLMNQTVCVNYTVQASDGTELSEKHSMRFFFPKEVELLAEQNGMKVCKIIALPENDKPIDITTWKVAFVLCLA